MISISAGISMFTLNSMKLFQVLYQKNKIISRNCRKNENYPQLIIFLANPWFVEWNVVYFYTHISSHSRLIFHKKNSHFVDSIKLPKKIFFNFLLATGYKSHPIVHSIADYVRHVGLYCRHFSYISWEIDLCEVDGTWSSSWIFDFITTILRYKKITQYFSTLEFGK